MDTYLARGYKITRGRNKAVTMKTAVWEVTQCALINTSIYRAIHKSLRDFRPLRYSSRDGHAEGEHANNVQRVWQELDYRIDICHVTKSGHIEHHVR